jgi:hypothetical protein
VNRKAVIIIATIAAAALALALVAVGSADKGDIYGGDHDVASGGEPLCKHCHIPHNAQGDYLWAEVPFDGYDPTASEDDAGADTCSDGIDNGDADGIDAEDTDCLIPIPPEYGDSAVFPLCFSCHDGSLTDMGLKLLNLEYHNHPQADPVYDEELPEDGAADGTCGDGIDNGDADGFDDADSDCIVLVDDFYMTEHSMYETYCKECMEPDCGKCHDPHAATWYFIDEENGRFPPSVSDDPAMAQEDGAGPGTCDDEIDNGEDGLTDAEDLDCSLGFQNASMCTFCHQGGRHGLGITHPETVTNPSGLMDEAGLPTDRIWDGDGDDFSGTRLWNASGTVVENTGAGYIFCKTCHQPHAAWDSEPAEGQEDWEALNSMDVAVEGSTAAPLCDNCHP